MGQIFVLKGRILRFVLFSKNGIDMSSERSSAIEGLKNAGKKDSKIH